MVRPVVLLYHRICADQDWRASEFVVPLSIFRAQMEFLARGPHRVCRLSEILAGRGPSAPVTPVVITFDDGYADFRTHAAPVLGALGLAAAVFPVLGPTPGSASWGAPPALHAPLLRLGDLRALEEDGFEFGSHTLTHPPLTSCREPELDRELRGSREALAAAVARPLDAVAYPFGAVDGRVKRAARRAGYTAGLAVGTGPLALHADPLEIRRQSMTSSASEAYLRMKLSGADKVLSWAKWRLSAGFRAVGERRSAGPA
jgi:peptidoglycan/xylan/chitin deacetylase (PgdA/CDA1 family)